MKRPVAGPMAGTWYSSSLKQPRPLLMLQAWSRIAQLSRAVPRDVDVSTDGLTKTLRITSSHCHLPSGGGTRAVRSQPRRGCRSSVPPGPASCTAPGGGPPTRSSGAIDSEVDPGLRPDVGGNQQNTAVGQLQEVPKSHNRRSNIAGGPFQSGSERVTGVLDASL